MVSQCAVRERGGGGVADMNEPVVEHDGDRRRGQAGSPAMEAVEPLESGYAVGAALGLARVHDELTGDRALPSLRSSWLGSAPEPTDPPRAWLKARPRYGWINTSLSCANRSAMPPSEPS
jgi:hypothetical protein